MVQRISQNTCIGGSGPKPTLYPKKLQYHSETEISRSYRAKPVRKDVFSDEAKVGFRLFIKFERQAREREREKDYFLEAMFHFCELLR